MSDDIIDCELESSNFDNLTMKAKEVLDLSYDVLFKSSSVMSDLANTLGKMHSEKKLVEDKISQIKKEIKEISTDINIECVEDADRMNELTDAIANNESKKVVINGLNKLIEKYNIDIELLLLDNYRHYGEWKGNRKKALSAYNSYRTFKLVGELISSIDSVFSRNGIYPDVGVGLINKFIESHISASVSAARDPDRHLQEKPDEAYSLMNDNFISDIINKLPGAVDMDNHILRQQRIAELAKKKESL